jgi:hypothetical protein
LPGWQLFRPARQESFIVFRLGKYGSVREGAMMRGLVGICVIAFAGWWSLSAAGESRGEDFVRIEVRGKLDKWTFNRVVRDRYAVMVERKKDKQPFLLLLPDDATRKAAQELVGQVVIVTGDGVVGVVVSDGKRKESTLVVTQVTVKSLKKADKPDNLEK